MGKMSEIIEETIGEERTSQGSLRDLYLVFFRHKWKMVLFFLTVTVVATVGTFLVAEIYCSEARLLVRLGRESVTLDPTATTGHTIQVSQSRQSEINSELEILKSREIVEKVVNSIGWEAFAKRPDERLSVEGSAREMIRRTRREIRSASRGSRSFLERLDLVDPIDEHKKAVLVVMKNLKVNVSRDSSIIIVSYEAQSPKLAQNVVAKVIDFYLEKHIAVHQTPGSHEFFLQQSNHLRNKLEKLEDELRNLKNETKISSLEEYRRVLVVRIGALEQEIEHTEAELVASNAKVEALKKSLQPTFLTEEANLSSLQAKVQTQKKQLEEAQKGLITLNDSEIKIKRLAREIGIEETNYQKYVDSLEQARIDHALEAGSISNICVVQPATVPIKPVRPRKMLNLALAILLGILGAVGLAVICEYLDHSIKTPEEVEERLHLPTLASIPRVQASRIFSAVKVRGAKGRNETPILWKSRVLAVKQRQEKTDSRISVIWKVPSEIKHHYEILADQLLLNSNGSVEKPRVLGIASCHPGEGVSTVAANLSASLARRISGDILLVNVSTTRTSVHRIFRNGQGNGDVVLGSPKEKLPLLTADSRNMNLLETLDSDRFTKQLSSVKKPYSFVVIDLPALSQASFVPRLSGLCDDVVMVVEAERLRWEVVRRAKEQLAKSQANILGVVLNKRRFHIPPWLYQTL